MYAANCLRQAITLSNIQGGLRRQSSGRVCLDNLLFPGSNLKLSAISVSGKKSVKVMASGARTAVDEISTDGAFVRKPATFRNTITADGSSGYPAVAGRFVYILVIFSSLKLICFPLFISDITSTLAMPVPGPHVVMLF